MYVSIAGSNKLRYVKFPVHGRPGVDGIIYA